MPIIRVEMISGRTREQKRNLVKELTLAFNRTCGATPADVRSSLPTSTRRIGPPPGA